MTFNDSIDQAWSLFNKYQTQINSVVVALLAVYLIAYLAEITWRLIPDSEIETQNTVTNTTSSIKTTNKQQTNINGIQRLHLFGEAGVEPVQQTQQVAQDAPETTLSLTLSGLVSSTEDNAGAAIIEYLGNQNTYGVGEKIEGTQAIVSEVHRDRIIISNAGRAETLMLDGLDFTKPNTLEIREYKEPVAASNPTPQKVRNIQNAAPRVISEEDLDLATVEAAKALRAKPERFTDFIAVQPDRKQGKINGYRVNPGRFPELFLAAGLEPNDVLKEINGLDLTDIKQSMQAMQLLKSAEFLELTLDRKGELTTLSLELPEE